MRFLLLFVLFIASGAAAQMKTTVFPPGADTLRLDSLIVLPSSLQFNIQAPRFIFKENTIILEQPIQDTLAVSYSTLNLPYTFTTAHKDTTMVRSSASSGLAPYVYTPDLFPTPTDFNTDLTKAGSISRGVAFGNNQNLSVNSNLNLQLSGKLNSRFQVLASVTDDNIPIQPNGNTAQLQDFDQVYIKLFDENNTITAGDFFIRESRYHFLKYQKRARGATVLSASGDSLRPLEISVSAALSKGKFARNILQGIEGNQGPYRLIGAENERFIIILAGTERVFLNGRLLKRGQEHDYVIDYNTAEIIFTPKNLITKDRRIVVEFQYSDRNYARALLQAGAAGKEGKFSWFVSAISEQDSKNQPLQQTLSPFERALLSGVGDNLNDAVVSSIDTTSFTDSQILYALRDTLGFDSVLVYSTTPAQAKYTAVFTFVGAGNGDYVEDQFLANGRVYKWVAPEIVDGALKKQGAYAPVRTLVTPKRRAMAVGGGSATFGDHTVQMEAALTSNDQNTFSENDSSDDTGTGIFTHWSMVKGKNTKLRTALSQEYISQNFADIERFRPVEFDRDWNIRNLELNADQHLLSSSVEVENKTIKSSLGAGLFHVGSSYKAYRANADLNYQKNQRRINWQASALSSQGLRTSSFYRFITQAAWPLGKHARVGYTDDFEFNQFFQDDSLTSASYRFHEWQTWLGSPEEKKFVWKTFYGQRNDFLPLAGALNLATFAREYGLDGTLKGQSATNMLRWNVRRRELTISDSTLSTLRPEETLVGRIETNLSTKKGWISGQMFYETGSGLEQQRKFIYVEVPAGQGSYVWNDYNADGVKDLNEFEIATFAYEANYIRSFVPSDEYVRTYTNVFSINGQLQPMRVWSSSSGLKKFISRWSDVYALRLDRKTTRDQGYDRLNPLGSDVADSTLISLGESFRNTLSYNRTDPNFGVEYTLQRVQTKALLSNGYESRGDYYNEVLVRKKVYTGITGILTARVGSKSGDSDFLTGRNFLINYNVAEPQLQWQPDNTFRLTLKGKRTEKENTLNESDERATLTDISAEARFSDPGRGLFSLDIHYIDIRYNGPTNTTLGFEMLEGLNSGRNFTWGASLQRSISNNLQLNILYNGRTAGDNPTIHAGSIQVRATF